MKENFLDENKSNFLGGIVHLTFDKKFRGVLRACTMPTDLT